MNVSRESLLDQQERRETDIGQWRRPSRLARITEDLPGVMAGMTQVIVDNPAQFALMVAGTVVLTRAAVNIVRPRTPLEALALMVVLQIGLPKLAVAAMENGWITFRVRGPDGKLVPLAGKTGDCETCGPVPAPA